MFSIFEEKGVMNKEQGMRYRKIILEKGGTEDPLALVKEFLGREPNSNAFLRSMGLNIRWLWRSIYTTELEEGVLIGAQSGDVNGDGELNIIDIVTYI